jgi:hypothetical protein
VQVLVDQQQVQERLSGYVSWMSPFMENDAAALMEWVELQTLDQRKIIFKVMSTFIMLCVTVGRV